MVAAEPFRSSGLAEGLFGSPEEAAAGHDETLSFSVKEVRELLSPSRSLDPSFLAKLTRDPRKTVRMMAYRAFNRNRNLASNEDIFRVGGIRSVAGADEAGRGALAGPLVAAAVVFPPGVVVDGVNDSKLLAPDRRAELYERIMEKAECVSVSFIDAGLIDRWGLQLVNYMALGDAVAGLSGRCQCLVCDHFSLRGLSFPAFGIPKADATFHSVASASIVAKVERDRVMISLHGRIPRYNFRQNKGYATEEHLTALAVYGPSRYHRMSFHGVGFEDDDYRLWED